MKMTSKGTFTLPAKVRKDFGLVQAGDTIWLRHSPGSRHAELDAPTTLEDIRAMADGISQIVPPEVLSQPLDMAAIRASKHEQNWKHKA